MVLMDVCGCLGGRISPINFLSKLTHHGQDHTHNSGALSDSGIEQKKAKSADSSPANPKVMSKRSSLPYPKAVSETLY